MEFAVEAQKLIGISWKVLLANSPWRIKNDTARN